MEASPADEPAPRGVGMELLLPGALSALFGAVTVLLFGRTWLAVLGIVAALILYYKGILPGKRCLVRMHGQLLQAVLLGLVLGGAFHIHLQILGHGESALEQVAYLLGCTPMLGLFFRDVSRNIDALFQADKF